MWAEGDKMQLPGQGTQEHVSMGEEVQEPHQAMGRPNVIEAQKARAQDGQAGLQPCSNHA